jgi:hypothetical protein
MCRTRGLGPLEMVATDDREEEGAWCALTGERGEVGVEVIKGIRGWPWLLPWLRVGW